VLPSVSNADDDLANDGAIIGATALSDNDLSAESPMISKPPNSNLISISLALNAILASLIVAMLIVRKTQARRGNQDSSIESQGTALQTLRQQLKTIEDAAKSDDLMAMRDAILMWGKTLFAERPPKTLKALAVSLEDKDIEQQFEQLDRQLFQDKNTDLPELDIKLLLSQIKHQSTFSRGSSSRNKAGQALKDLYPT
jgi:NACalpha-BTF3-like transcription factor